MILLTLLAGCNPADRDLSEIIIFEKGAECRFAPETLRIFGAMIEYDESLGPPRRGGAVEIAGIGTLQPTFDGSDEDGFVHARLLLKGRWNGLIMIGLEHGFIPNSGVSYHRILFAEPPSAARERLNRMGFDLPSPGKAREFGDGMSQYIGMEDYGSGSALECST